ncbi:YbjQ family protein [Halomonas cupida]|uniref:YbjQ family protein n=1 Tax=Halomonas cupida TaxID=44933 RepID=UPI0039B3F498
MSDSVILTTSSQLEGYRVVEHLDIVSAECVFGMNILKDMFAGIRDIFGGRNKSSQNALRDARVSCLEELRREAGEMGANAVIAVDLDYSEISGGGKSMLFLVATGTAVRVART